MVIDQGIARWAEKKRNIEILGKAITALLECCYGERLRCIDPPTATTGMLYSLGLYQYAIRSFWKDLPLGVASIPVYKYLNTSFQIEVEHIVGPVRELRCGDRLIPVDRIDARSLETVFSPHSHAIYLRLAGRIEGNIIRINIIRLAKLMETYDPGSVQRTLGGILKMYDSRRMLRRLEGELLDYLKRWRGILRLILPYMPEREEELLKVSPILRWLKG